MTQGFKIRITRIETVSIKETDDFTQVTFRIEAGASSYHLPILVNRYDFDDADLPKVARSILHQTFAALSGQTEEWKLTQEELTQLASWKFYQGA
jgi:hypothetical protein